MMNEDKEVNMGDDLEGVKSLKGKKRGRPVKVKKVLSSIKGDDVSIGNNFNKEIKACIDISNNGGGSLYGKRYKDAYMKLLNELPGWKREVVMSKDNASGIYNNFIKDVIILAEREI